MGEVAALKERVTSGAFKIGGCKWMIVVYPRGKVAYTLDKEYNCLPHQLGRRE